MPTNMPTKKIYINTFAQIFSKILTALISIGMIKILTNYLDIEGYGMYSKIYNYLSIFAVIADLGLYTITVRELSRYKDDPIMVEKISWNVLTLRTLSGVIICFLSLWIAPFIPWYDSPWALISIAIVSLFTLFGLINSSLLSYLQATLRTEFTVISNTSGKLLTLWMIVAFSSVFFPVSSGITETNKLLLIFSAGLSGNILMTALTYWYVNRFQKVRFHFDFSYIKYILLLSLPYWLALFLGAISFKVDVILLSILEDETIADTAIALYSLPMKIVEVGMMYGTVFLNSLLPVLTHAVEKQDTKRIHSLTRHTFFLLGIWWICASWILYFFAPTIIWLISTQEYIHESLFGYTAVDALQIVAFIFLFYFLSSLWSYIMIARGDQKRIIYINIWVALANIIGNIIFIPSYSFIWSAYVTLITQGVLVLLTYAYVRKDIKIL